ncbi:MAG: RecX family transcriptional regulator [Anaeroplasma bactoclasticum]|nr:RecX family transcriptional regulator [Anaeroplasma bactoclasticum]
MKSNETYVVEAVQKKGKKYLVQFENNDDPLTLTEDQIVEFRVIKGSIFSDSDFEKIKASIELSTYYAKSIRYIDFKPRTKKEVVEYLQSYGLDQDSIIKLIQKLEQIGYIDDERYVSRFVEECIRKGKGRYYIIQTLSQKGINKEFVFPFLAEYDKDVEIENAMALASKILFKITDYPVRKQKLQIQQKLLSAGFHSEIINYVINHLSFENHSQERLKKEVARLKEKNLEKEKIITKLLAKGYEYIDIKKVL